MYCVQCALDKHTADHIMNDRFTLFHSSKYNYGMQYDIDMKNFGISKFELTQNTAHTKIWTQYEFGV